MADLTERAVTLETEHSILCYISDLHDGGYVCARCRQPITPETAWKPMVTMITEGETKDIHTIVTYIICGPCVVDAWRDITEKKH